MNILRVSSEISPLRKVIVHRPDRGVSHVTPKRSDELLFDDIVFLPEMQKEHDQFTSLLKAFCGDDGVVDWHELLLEALELSEQSKFDLIDEVLQYAELPKTTRKFLVELPNSELANLLVTGHHPAEELTLFDPIPNFVFTRDLAITVNDHLVLAKAATEARSRENFIVRFVIQTHPLFAEVRKQNKLIDLNDYDAFPQGRRGEPVRVEGGDVMVLNESYLLIGISERTNAHTADLLAKALFAKDVIDHVVMVVIPNDRAYMHLDTIFTQVDSDLYAAFGPIILDGLSSYVTVVSASGTRRNYPSVAEFIHAEISAEAKFIVCGDGQTPHQEREQWTDACNLVALRPGIAVTYDRNTVTAEVFARAGYEVVTAAEILQKASHKSWDPTSITKTIITLPSAELSRARGGGHCMTCPIIRD